MRLIHRAGVATPGTEHELLCEIGTTSTTNKWTMAKSGKCDQ